MRLSLMLGVCVALAAHGAAGAAEVADTDAMAMLAPRPIAPLSSSPLSSSPPLLAPAAVPSSDAPDVVAAGKPVAVPASAADRLRDDPVQRAAVPAAAPLPPVKLSTNERIIARHIARSYRVANESIERFVHYAFKAAREFRLDPHLILAVMAVESSFNPEAQSSAGAQGLMQVLTRVHMERFAPFGGPEAVWDPLANIKVGASILSEYVKRYGDVAAGLKAYVGAALLESDGGYGNKVMSRQAEFESVVRPKPATTLQAKADGEVSAKTARVAGDAASAGSIAISGSGIGASLGL